MSPITSIALHPGQTGFHVTVEDQAGNPLPPSSLTWVLDPATAPLVTVMPDATGFNFAAVAGAGDVTGSASVTYTPNGVSLSIPLTIVSPVTGLQLVSP